MTPWPLAGQAALMMFPLLMIIAGAGDVMTLRIPNRLIMILMATFPPFAFAVGMSPLIFAIHVATAAVLLTAGFALFSLRLFGGGDAKLLAAAALWLGFPCAIPFVFFTAIAGGVLALAIGIMHAVQQEAEVQAPALGRLFTGFRPDVPYGFAIAIGAILTLPLTWWTVVAGH